MARMSFIEPSADGAPAIEVYVTNPDEVYVFLSLADDEDATPVSPSYWQLQRIMERIHDEFLSATDKQRSVFRHAP